MKKKIAAVSMTVIVGGLLYFTGIRSGTAHDTGAPAGYTGSPYDGRTCDHSSCHNTNALQSAKPWILSNVPVSGFLPDSTYTMTAKAVYLGDGSFGFEISPQTPSGSPVGTLIVTNSTTTQIETSGSLQYITHTVYGYEGTDSLVWTFEWKAPAVLTDSVIFYGAFNCGNGNASAANTYVYPATLIIYGNKTAGINNILARDASFSVFPNPAREQITISYNLKETDNVKVTIYGMDGKKSANLFSGMVKKGEHNDDLWLPSRMNPGMYFIQLIANGQSTVQRIMVE